MEGNYFDFLQQNSQQDKTADDKPKTDDSINLTVRADAECQLVCDGDFLELLKPNQIVKLKAPVGEHLLQFISIDYPDICVEKVVSWPEPGKNHLVIVNELKQMLAEEAGKAEAEAIITLEFTARLGGKGKYTGTLKDGKPEGRGKVIFDCGDTYEGDFHNGWRHGKGIQVFADGSRYEGDFKEDMRTGLGVLSKPDGRRWEGGFVDGVLNGKVKCYFADGATLEGIWENGDVANKPNIYTWANGDRFECEGYDKGSHGKGMYYWADGRNEEMTYRHGSRVQEIKEKENIVVENVVRPSSQIKAIDLGLSVKWADMDFEADTPEKTGATINYWKPAPPAICDDPDSTIILGDNWRLPTLNEFQELLAKCSWTAIKGRRVVDENGIPWYDGYGYRITSMINGNSIFLPVDAVEGFSFDNPKARVFIEESLFWIDSYTNRFRLNRLEELVFLSGTKPSINYNYSGESGGGRIRLVAK